MSDLLARYTSVVTEHRRLIRTGSSESANNLYSTRQDLVRELRKPENEALVISLLHDAPDDVRLETAADMIAVRPAECVAVVTEISRSDSAASDDAKFMLEWNETIRKLRSRGEL